MQRPYLKIKKLHPNAVLPSKREEDAGYDIYATHEGPLLLRPGEVHLMPTGIAMQIPQDWVFYVAERGSTGSKGIAKRAGIVDSGYRGELFVAINNASHKPILFYRDEVKADALLKEQGMDKEQVTLYPLTKAIAQGLLLYCPHVDVEEVQALSESERKGGMLGSSGK